MYCPNVALESNLRKGTLLVIIIISMIKSVENYIFDIVQRKAYSCWIKHMIISIILLNHSIRKVGRYQRYSQKLLKHYYKRDEIHFPIVNFSFICSNIFQHHIWNIYLSFHLIFLRLCSYHDFVDRGLLLTRKQQNQRFLDLKLTWLT